MGVYRCHRCSIRHIADERPSECALCGYPSLWLVRREAGLGARPRAILPKRLRSRVPHHGPVGHALPLASFETDYIQTMFRKQAGRCALCGHVMRFEDGLSVDHIRPLSLGGKNLKSNKQLTHAACNGQKGNAVSIPPDAQAEGCAKWLGEEIA